MFCIGLMAALLRLTPLKRTIQVRLDTGASLDSI